MITMRDYIIESKIQVKENHLILTLQSSNYNLENEYLTERHPKVIKSLSPPPPHFVISDFEDT